MELCRASGILGLGFFYELREKDLDLHMTAGVPWHHSP